MKPRGCRWLTFRQDAYVWSTTFLYIIDLDHRLWVTELRPTDDAPWLLLVDGQSNGQDTPNP